MLYHMLHATCYHDTNYMHMLYTYVISVMYWNPDLCVFVWTSHNFAVMFVFIPNPLKTQKLHRVVVNGIDG